VEVKIKAKGWQWKKDAGNQYDAFLLECVGLEDFPVSGAAIIRRNPKTEDTKPTHKALNELMLDCFKKVRESRNKRRRAAAREELAAEVVTSGGGAGADAGSQAGHEIKRSRYEKGKPVVMYILDPENQEHHPGPGRWNWDCKGAKMLGVIYDPSLNDLHLKVSAHLPDGRKVRQIIGALENAYEDDEDEDDEPADVTHIRSDDELDGFLRLTEAKPVKILVILHSATANRPNTPSPRGANAETYYFSVGRFDGPEYYVDPVEDSDEEVGRRAGGRRGVPRKDHTFEELLEAIRRRIRRQNQHLTDTEAKHKAAYPDAIHESDPGGKLRVFLYGEEDNLSGKQVIKFRTVVADYVADVAARTAAGGNQTSRQIKAAAANQIKTDLNDPNGPYADLGLPETIA
jgi:hypothetical protein